MSLIRKVVPSEYQEACIGDFGESVVPGDIDYGQYGFCLRGKTGIGKTHMAAALAREYMNPEHPHTIVSEVRICGEFSRYAYENDRFVWISVPSLLSRIRSTFGNQRSRESEHDILMEMIGSKLMILDDLGSEKSSDFSASTLYAIISERRNWRKPTIVTTNQTLKEIASWEPRIASRLAEMATIRLPNVDRRAMRAQEAARRQKGMG